MKPNEERLSRMSEQWTLLDRTLPDRATLESAEPATGEWHALLRRYCGAVYRYLVDVVGEEAAAEELYRQFALRFLRAGFRPAGAGCGRLRDYAKSAVFRLADDHLRRDTGGPPRGGGEPSGEESEDRDAKFMACWRDELLRQAWRELAQAQPAYHEVLRLHAAHPGLGSAGLAGAMAARRRRPVTAGNLRVMLHRARARFADLLVAEVARTIQSPTRERLVDELRELRLMALGSSALKRRRC